MLSPGISGRPQSDRLLCRSGEDTHTFGLCLRTSVRRDTHTRAGLPPGGFSLDPWYSTQRKLQLPGVYSLECSNKRISCFFKSPLWSSQTQPEKGTDLPASECPATCDRNVVLFGLRSKPPCPSLPFHSPGQLLKMQRSVFPLWVSSRLSFSDLSNLRISTDQKFEVGNF